MNDENKCNNSNHLIEVRNVTKVYKSGIDKVIALNNVSFDINEGEICCILGTSGSGKSTLLNILAGIEKVTSGDVYIKGKNICMFTENQLSIFRQKYLGFVFQSYNLINSLNALENVEMPLIFKRIEHKERIRLAKEALELVGLTDREKHKPNEMSGGQQQRVGIARAFVTKPDIVFADEPTGNLDTKTAISIITLLKKMAKENNETIIMVTHDVRMAEYADKIIKIQDGIIEGIEDKNNDDNKESKDNK